MVKLDIISDPICPWCYIGKTNLDNALMQFPDHPFIIEWHPFQLNPDMPSGGMDRREYLETKFGGKEDGFIAAFAQSNCGDVTPNLNLNNTGPGENEFETRCAYRWIGRGIHFKRLVPCLGN